MLHTPRSPRLLSFTPGGAVALTLTIAAVSFAAAARPSNTTLKSTAREPRASAADAKTHRERDAARRDTSKTPSSGKISVEGTNATVPTAPIASGTEAPSDHGRFGAAQSLPSAKPNVSYIDLNPIVRDFCNLLNVDPGSLEWAQWGCELFPGQTGGQSDFGWRQDHRVPNVNNPKYKQAAAYILTNAGYRPIYYIDAIGGTRKGYGRPWDWVADPVIDDPILTGWKAPNGKVVVGHDAQHFSLKYLAALAQGDKLTDECIAAKVFMWRMAAEIGGMLRTDYFKETIHSSREVGRTLDFAVDCVKYSLLDDQDAQAIIDWVTNAVLPSILPNGIGFVYKPGQQGYKTEPQLGNVDYWFPWQDGLEAAGLDRLGRYLQSTDYKPFIDAGNLIRVKARAIAMNTANVISHTGNCPKAVGMDGKIAWVGDEGLGYAAWCYRALRIAGDHEKANTVFDNFKDKPDWWCWLVEPDDNFNPKLPIAK